MGDARRPGPASLLATLDVQPRVRTFLMRAVEEDRVSHAYLFLGAPGAGRLDAARALAQALVCPAHGCGACEECVRVARRTHPDVHLLAPESVTGYLIGQIRDFLDDVALAPIRGARKVYIIDRAEMLRPDSANALLKTLEEPPAGVTFILLGTSVETILPTIVSRCQCVPFRTIAPEAAARAVARETGAPDARCAMAVAVTGSPTRAVEFLRSASRQEARRLMIRALDALPRSDDMDVLRAAKELVSAVKAPLDEVRATQQAVLDRDADYLSRGALKQLEDRHKRELSARERSGMMEVLASARVLLRDVLMVCAHTGDALVDEDAVEVVERLSRTADAAGALRALEAVSRAGEALARNVSPQLTLEVMLLDIRKALTCR